MSKENNRQILPPGSRMDAYTYFELADEVKVEELIAEAGEIADSLSLTGTHREIFIELYLLTLNSPPPPFADIHPRPTDKATSNNAAIHQTDSAYHGSTQGYIDNQRRE